MSVHLESFVYIWRVLTTVHMYLTTITINNRIFISINPQIFLCSFKFTHSFLNTVPEKHRFHCTQFTFSRNSYKRNHTVYTFLYLAALIHHDILKLQLCCFIYQWFVD